VGSLGSVGVDSPFLSGRKRIATKKLAIQLQDSESEERAGIAGEGTISETKRNGTGPNPIEKDACDSVVEASTNLRRREAYNKADDSDC
jgi:hypothetical protein